MPRPACSLIQLVMLSTALAGLAGCSNDDDARVARAPEGFSIVEVATASGSVADSGASITVSCGEPLLVRIGPIALTDDGAPDPQNYFELKGFTLKPAGGCGTEINCGWIELAMTAPTAESASASSTKYLSAQSVVRIDPPGTNGWQPGTYKFRASLIDSDGAVVNGGNNQPARGDFSIELVVPEPCSTALQG